MGKNSTKLGRFEIEERIPVEYLPALMEQCRDLDQVIPSWCNEVFIDYGSELGPDCAASTAVHYDYRRATIWLSPKFFQEKERQEMVLVHEVCHITQEPLWNAVNDVQSRLSELDKGNEKLVNEILRHAREQTVCDMARIMMIAKIPF